MSPFIGLFMGQQLQFDGNDDSKGFMDLDLVLVIKHRTKRNFLQEPVINSPELEIQTDNLEH